MVILGAGASRACPNNHPNLPMPLLRDLPDVLRRFNPESSWHWFGQNLDRLLALTGGDIEVFLTLLYRLNECFFVPRGQYALDLKFLDQILASSALPEFFTVPLDARQATAILQLLRTLAAEDGAAITSFSPQNFFTLFRGALRDYFNASFQRYPCPLHFHLFETLERFDCVVSFNYDHIADYSLHSAGKLTQLSFEGLGFTEVWLPQQWAGASVPLTVRLPRFVNDRLNCVKFLKVHGSFNWFCRMQEGEQARRDDWTYSVGPAPHLSQSALGGPEVRYCLGVPDPGSDMTNWTPSPVILPFLTKDFIYRENAMFARHLAAFQHELRAADEIYIVGKNFQNSDQELNGMIRYATYGERDRTLHIIDPSPGPEFEPFHCSLFNARLGRRYTSFEEYARVSH